MDRLEAFKAGQWASCLPRQFLRQAPLKPTPMPATTGCSRPIAFWRRVEVPLTASLKALHEVIQAAMPFDDCHLFEFHVDGKRYAIPECPLQRVPVIRRATSERLA
jgi:hypothetical protein